MLCTDSSDMVYNQILPLISEKVKVSHEKAKKKAESHKYKMKKS